MAGLAGVVPRVAGVGGLVLVSIGFAAGILTSIAAVPQVVQTVRTGSTRDLSLWQPVILSVGLVLWMVHGLQIGDSPLIAACNILAAGHAVLACGEIALSGFSMNQEPAEAIQVYA